MRIEQFDQLGEVGERARQPVDLVDDDHIDPASADVIKDFLERRPLHRAARVATVVVASADELPALVGLALDIGLRRLPLIVERVELLLQAMLGRDAGVDGAAQSCLGFSALTARPPSCSPGSLSYKRARSPRLQPERRRGSRRRDELCRVRRPQPRRKPLRVGWTLVFASRRSDDHSSLCRSSPWSYAGNSVTA